MRPCVSYRNKMVSKIFLKHTLVKYLKIMKFLIFGCVRNWHLLNCFIIVFWLWSVCKVRMRVLNIFVSFKRFEKRATFAKGDLQLNRKLCQIFVFIILRARVSFECLKIDVKLIAIFCTYVCVCVYANMCTILV